MVKRGGAMIVIVGADACDATIGTGKCDSGTEKVYAGCHWWETIEAV